MISNLNQFQLEWRVCKEESGLLLREFLKKKGISRTALTDIKFNGGNIFVNNREETVRFIVSEQDSICVIFPPEKRSEELLPEKIPLDIVYEDNYVLIVNKPHHLPSIPSREHPTSTLANGIAYYYDEQNIQSTVHIVTRLDKDTSGLMLVAKNRFVHHLFAKEQQKKAVKRVYSAIVHGNIEVESGVIDAPIGRKDTSIIERTVREDGQYAVTYFEKISRYTDCTLVKAKLETGRTHQIRVHFAYIGHPLLGDELYGGKVDCIERQALHSTELSFYHPFLEKELTFYSELPNDMKNLIEGEGN